MTVEVKRAYFNALATRKLVIEIIKEDKLDSDGDAVGGLHLSLYGTRDAAFQWGERVAVQLEQNGFKRGKAFSSMCVNEERQNLTMVHGDDYLSTGLIESLKRLDEKPKGEFEVKTKILGKHKDLEKEAKVLNRVLRITESGWEIEADQRHVELVIEQLGLKDCKPVITPGISSLVAPLDDDEEDEDDCR